MGLLWKKVPEPLSSRLSWGLDRDQFTVKTVTPHTHTQRHTVHSLSAPGTLEHLHHLRALGVMATVSMTTAEKLDDGDETAGSSDEELWAKEQSTCPDPPVISSNIPLNN